MSVERFEQQHPASPTDRLLVFATGFLASQPLVAGVITGLFAGALANSGLAFFIVTAVATAFGLHIAGTRDA